MDRTTALITDPMAVFAYIAAALRRAGHEVSVLDAVLLRPLPYMEADRLVQIAQKTTPDRLAAGSAMRTDAPVNQQTMVRLVVADCGPRPRSRP